ncbi:PTS lactose/cellobiose transporter subunit IIA [Morganella psychrotolerans]|uniref:PTS lactose/cellobiose transporter subunit IIA n=1 Tax=Morganella psychrotolerans TaxID=368603 RepID=A0A5M9RDD2_9GAMM|nr:PTS lactose/cellobiose transporter subunit IIA [Morganella psychrotolerans]KAA8717968.1 PTS lactose/cellobiose transporter subunit IIA [Morganella psychrotolerans]
MTQQTTETDIITLITCAGSARSLVFQAIREARENRDFPHAEILMQQAKEMLSGAHWIQTQLISLDEGEGKIPVTLALVHAQDHLMNAVLLTELGTEIIALHRQIAEKPKDKR